MKAETQGATQRTQCPMAPCSHALELSGWRCVYGGLSADLLTVTLPCEAPWCADLGPGRVQGSQGEAWPLVSPALVCALLLGPSCSVLSFSVWASVSSLPSFSIMKGKVGPSPGIHSGPGPLCPASLSRKTGRLCYWSSVMSDLGQLS